MFSQPADGKLFFLPPVGWYSIVAFFIGFVLHVSLRFYSVFHTVTCCGLLFDAFHCGFIAFFFAVGNLEHLEILIVGGLLFFLFDLRPT